MTILVGGKEMPAANKLAVGVHAKDGQIIDVKPYTHRVDWVESGPSVVAYCNVCGEAWKRYGTLRCDDGVERAAFLCVCGAFLGWTDWKPNEGKQ